MNRRLPATFVTTLFFCLVLAPAAAAQSAKGLYDFTFTDEYLKHLEFDAAKLADGTSTGKIYFTDDEPIDYTDLDGTGDRSLVASYKGFFITAEVDDLVVNKNQAVMSATIRDSSILDLVGQRVLLAVEDNGDNTKVPDQLTWGGYRFVQRTWTPSDAELKDDPGVGLRWWATDAERKDDIGYAMPRAEQPVGTQTFPVGAYEFVTVSRASGDIAVSP